MRETTGSAAAPAASCKNVRRGSFLATPPFHPSLFDHLVGAGERSGRYSEAERLRCLEFDHQFVLGGCLHRHLAGLLPLEDAVDVAGGTPILFDKISSIRDQTAARNEQA